ncbi:MAG: hypothetical protein RMJ39_10900 [Deltaproteobacteria bacterium]|nr:hypothetical protein [Deltaproteobacteria bacterium]
MKRITDTLNISRSNQYTRKTSRRERYKPKPDDSKSLSLIREITDKRPTYGVRRVTTLINRYLRIMKINHLLLPKYTGRPIKNP